MMLHRRIYKMPDFEKYQSDLIKCYLNVDRIDRNSATHQIKNLYGINGYQAPANILIFDNIFDMLASIFLIEDHNLVTWPPDLKQEFYDNHLDKTTDIIRLSKEDESIIQQLKTINNSLESTYGNVIVNQFVNKFSYISDLIKTAKEEGNKHYLISLLQFMGYRPSINKIQVPEVKTILDYLFQMIYICKTWSTPQIDFESCDFSLLVPAFFHKQGKFNTENKMLMPFVEMAEANLGYIIPFANVCFACEKYTRFSVDMIGRLDCSDGPAFEDGPVRSYHVAGVEVPEYVIEDPQRININEIDDEGNQEVRRVMLEKFTIQRYLNESNAKIVDHHERWGTLYEKQVDGETFKFHLYTNSSPEPDGSFKKGILMVPKEMERAHQSVAWTFQRTEETYNPLYET